MSANINNSMLAIFDLYVLDKIYNSVKDKIKLDYKSKMVYQSCLTYHFKDKGALLKSISNQMWIEFDKEKQKTTILPSFENIYNEIKIFHKLRLRM